MSRARLGRMDQAGSRQPGAGQGDTRMLPLKRPPRWFAAALWGGIAAASALLALAIGAPE